jgi:hypothetical protein
MIFIELWQCDSRIISQSTIAPGPGTDHHLDMDSVAVVGMSIKVADADDLDDSVDMLIAARAYHP